MNSKTAFAKGDLVTVERDLQGLKKGEMYQVAEVLNVPTPFGDFVTYRVTDGSNDFPIVNGHLLLTLVKREESNDGPKYWMTESQKREEYKRESEASRLALEAVIAQRLDEVRVKMDELSLYIHERVSDGHIAVSLGKRCSVAGTLQAVKELNELVGQYNSLLPNLKEGE